MDVMGEASAQAQSLKNPITSGSKMLSSESQTVFMLVDKHANSDQGAVVGMLKVGRKKLFLLDSAGKPNEMTPMCVLDFYVTETRQRTGCGKKLFETFLRRENVDPKYLAIDRPSEKLISFLRKHYNLANIIPQVKKMKKFDVNHHHHVSGEQLCNLFWFLQRSACISHGNTTEETKNLHGEASVCVAVRNTQNILIY